VGRKHGWSIYTVETGLHQPPTELAATHTGYCILYVQMLYQQNEDTAGGKSKGSRQCLYIQRACHILLLLSVDERPWLVKCMKVLDFISLIAPICSLYVDAGKT